MTTELARSDGVRRLHPIRVLVVSDDRRFLRMAVTILSQAGCDVAAVESPRRVLDVVERHRSNVVMIDATHRIASVARALAAIQAAPTPIQVVAVAENPATAPLRHLPLIAKWNGSQLVASVERVFDDQASPALRVVAD